MADRDKVHYFDLLPHEFRRRLTAYPVGYLPLGTIEWHGEIDHAAKNETSLMMALHPPLVDLGQLPASRDEWPEGVRGEDPRDSSAEHGEECTAESLAALEVTLRRLGF